MRAVDQRADPLTGWSRANAVYHALSRAFIEMDTGDKRFLAALSSAAGIGPERASPAHAGGSDEYILTIPHFWALTHLEPEDGRTMAELARLLICDRSNVTKIVDKLEELGWARRAPVTHGDRRYIRVVLTTEGRATSERVRAAHSEWVRRRFAVFSLAQLDQLEALLTLVLAGAQLDPEGAAHALADDAAVATPTPPPAAPERRHP
jgi:DNA-binding MarR family transcriptional regulator